MEKDVHRMPFPLDASERRFFPAVPSLRLQSTGSRYSFSVVAVLLCFLLRAELIPLMANRQPYVIFTCAVALATLLGGAGPGLLALILGCLGGSILSENPILPLKLLPTSAGDFANLFASSFRDL
jgi:hypothetical protein